MQHVSQYLGGLGYKSGLREWNKRCHNAGCGACDGMDIDQIAKALKTLRLKVRSHRYRGQDQVRRFIDRGPPLLFGQGEDMFEDGDHWMFIYGCSKRQVYVGNVISPLQSTELWGWKRFRRELNTQELYSINV